MIPKISMQSVRRGQYVRIESDIEGQRKNFFARISRGPFFIPDAVSRDSAFAKAAILYAGTIKFRPDYHAYCYAQIMGELDPESMKTFGTFTRPRPQAAVFALTGKEIEKLLELEGDMYIGFLSGYPGVRVGIPSYKNAALPRNVGIFGTVGSGKTNTSQVIIEEAANHNWAVVVLDVEGEYVDMDKASREKPLQNLFKQYGIEPAGVKALDVYHPVNSEPARSDSKPFSVRFGGIDPSILAEIMGLSPPQNERFLETWHKLNQKAYSSKKQSRSTSGFVKAMVDGIEGGQPSGVTLQGMIQQVEAILEDEKTKGANRTSFFSLLRKLRSLQRYEVFDQRESLGDYSDLLRANTVSIIDLSGAYSSQIKNIILMDLLRRIFKLKLDDRKRELPPVLIAIEEAHTLVSRDNASKMEETLDILREISRRGRKRWISLCFISQQPSHLPPEIYELCNTKISHQTTGGRNLDAIKSATGGVDPSVWDDLPRLGQGTCLFISSYFKNRPMFVNVRPCRSSRRHVEEE
jgi:DNA helicase HerA-like ATPase